MKQSPPTLHEPGPNRKPAEAAAALAAAWKRPGLVVIPVYDNAAGTEWAKFPNHPGGHHPDIFRRLAKTECSRSGQPPGLGRRNRLRDSVGRPPRFAGDRHRRRRRPHRPPKGGVGRQPRNVLSHPQRHPPLV